MTTSLLFRAALAKRVLLAAGMFGSTTLLACGDSGSGAGGAAPGGSGAGGGAQGGEAQGGEAAGGAAAGGDAQGGAGGQAQGGDGGGTVGQENVERCFANPDPDAACPALRMAPTFFQCTDTFELVLEWLSGPVEQDTLCCYQVDVSAPNDAQCAGVGRPFMVANVAERARVVVTHAVDAWRVDGMAPDVSRLSADTRASLAKVWANDASYEHASVASFAKFSLDLLAFGAPATLVRRAHQAALDEVHHAELGFALASSYAGRALGPSELSAAADMRCSKDLEAFLTAVIREGCVGETLAATVASAQQIVACDPAVRSALSTIARDEASHAELAWQTISWALCRFGDDAARIAEAAFDAAIDDALAVTLPVEVAHHAHGRLSSDEHRRERQRAIDEVVRPALSALLAA